MSGDRSSRRERCGSGTCCLGGLGGKEECRAQKSFHALSLLLRSITTTPMTQSRAYFFPLFACLFITHRRSATENKALRNDYVIAAQGTMMRLQAISDGLQNRDPPITKRLENGSETEYYCIIITGWRRFQPQFILLIFDEYFQTAVIILSASGDTYNHPTPLFRNTVPPPHPNTCRPFTIFCLS